MAKKILSLSMDTALIEHLDRVASEFRLTRSWLVEYVLRLNLPVTTAILPGCGGGSPPTSAASGGDAAVPSVASGSPSARRPPPPRKPDRDRASGGAKKNASIRKKKI